MNRRRRRIAATTVAVVALGTPSSPVSAAAPKPPPGDRSAQAVVKLDAQVGASIGDVARDHALLVVRDVLGSRGIYLVRGRDTTKGSPPNGKALAAALSKDRRVEYAEPNYATDTSDDRFHAWPDGDPDFVGTDPAVWSGQRAATDLQLAAVHDRARGARVKVAVLDTGIDASHPVFARRLSGGHDYVDDDSDPSDRRDGRDGDGDGNVDEAFGHGTHVAGIVALVAPEARIVAMRVLDADGVGNVFAVAEALDDAADQSVDVVNMSFGTADNVESKVLKDAVHRAQKAGVVVVASAGNDASGERRFPASMAGVVAVGGEDVSASRLAVFSNRGKWIHAAAPSVAIVSAVPGGGFASWSGTSMAAPFVSGQISLLRGLRPKLTRKQVGDAIDKSSHVLPDAGKDDPRAIDILDSVDRLR